MRLFALTIFLAIGMSGCFMLTKGTKKDLDAYEAHMKASDEAIIRGDFTEAELRLGAAGEIADQIEWSNGRVNVKMSFANMYLIQHRSKESEATYLEAQRLCQSASDCTYLPNIYSWLIWLYAYDMHDGTKARNLVEEVIQDAPRVTEDETLRAILNEYAAELRGGGMEADASWVESRITKLPPDDSKP